MPRRPTDRSGPPPVVLPTVHLARNNPADVLRARRSSGSWERIARGVYLPGEPVDNPDRSLSVALGRIVGVHHRLVAAHWFSHESAALLWGLPLWITPTRTHLMQRHTASSSRDPSVRHHPVVPPEDQRAVLGGLPVTSLELTVVDCTSTLPAMQGLVVADAALRAGADREVIERVLASRTGRRGVTRARAVISLADDGADSPGESAARFVILRDGLPPPQTQVPVVTRLGTFWCDLGWEEWRLALEYDGRGKYDGRATDEFVREKRRHDALLEADWRVLRVTKEDLRGTTLTRRILQLIPAGSTTALRPRRALRG
ncbi:hypothetical protein [Cellulomonas humilata]|uniref:Transcriptional regulator, AbiEi antitoxin, Type IV TA system n=1 Tax=Cellulomonas humilata TaxID=144055 RepID=A0ABU0EJI4_9CELL|nr:hypothetical protein [Cellulomonas humilata]MDQ0375454.1 hypothetical protein [Cellulomonas humilata]